MQLIKTIHLHANGLVIFVACAILFPTIVSCDDQTTKNAEELVTEKKEEMTSATGEMVELAEESARESVSQTEDVIDETVDGSTEVEQMTELSSVDESQAPQVVAEAEQESPATEKAAESDDTGDKPYTVSADGKVDWYTFNGYRRYHSECHVCHGPAGLGSSFAPNLTESVKNLGYEGYLEIVVNGRTTVSNVENKNMPAFATNMNVMCYVDDIYAYLVARADGVVGTERPDKEAKPEAAKERDDSCAG